MNKASRMDATMSEQIDEVDEDDDSDLASSEELVTETSDDVDSSVDLSRVSEKSETEVAKDNVR